MRMFEPLACAAPADVVMIDSPAVHTQRASAGADGGLRLRAFLLSPVFSPGNIADITVAPDIGRHDNDCQQWL